MARPPVRVQVSFGRRAFAALRIAPTGRLAKIPRDYLVALELPSGLVAVSVVPPEPCAVTSPEATV